MSSDHVPAEPVAAVRQASDSTSDDKRVSEHKKGGDEKRSHHQQRGDDRAVVIKGFQYNTANALYHSVLSILSALCGPILSHAVSTPSAGGESISIIFEHKEAAETAVMFGGQALSPLGVVLTVEKQKADPRTLVPNSNVIVLKNLSYDLSLEALREFLHTLPVKPVSVDMHIDNNAAVIAHASPKLKALAGPSDATGHVKPTFTGVAFAKYSSPEEARIVMQHVHGAALSGRTVKAEYKRVKFGGMASPFTSSLGSPPLPSPLLSALVGSPLRDPTASPGSAAAFALNHVAPAETIPFLSLQQQPTSSVAATFAEKARERLRKLSESEAVAKAETTQAAAPGGGSTLTPSQTEMRTVFASLVAARVAAKEKDEKESAVGTTSATTTTEATSTSQLSSDPVFASFSSPLAEALLASLPPGIAPTGDSIDLGVPELSATTASASGESAHKASLFAKSVFANPSAKRSLQRQRSRTSGEDGDGGVHAPEDKTETPAKVTTHADKSSASKRERSNTIDTVSARGKKAVGDVHDEEGGSSDSDDGKAADAKKKKSSKKKSGKKEKRPSKSTSIQNSPSLGPSAPRLVGRADAPSWRDRLGSSPAATTNTPAGTTGRPRLPSTSITASPVISSAGMASLVAAVTDASGGAVRYARGPGADSEGRGFARSRTMSMADEMATGQSTAPAPMDELKI